jgi:signal transduction histidine kinase
VTDSYDLLAESIERVIRSDLPPPKSEQELGTAIDRLMLEEARAGELRIAYLRLAVVAPLVFLSIRALAGGSSASVALIPVVSSILWLTVSTALVIALRRGWYRRWLSRFMPAVTATMILAVFLPFVTSDQAAWRESAPEMVAYAASLCGFLSLSAALRLSRSSAETSTILALIVFVTVAVSAGLAPVPSLAIAIALVGTGLLSGSVMTLVRRVVTDEVAKATLTQMYHESEAAISARDRVMRIVVHDLRDPLSTITMSTSTMLDAELAREQQIRFVEIITRAVKRMDKLVDDLLDVARLEKGTLGLKPREVDVAIMLRNAHSQMALRTQGKSITLDLAIEEGLPPIAADPDRLEQALSNLVGNAIKFTEAGGRIAITAKPIPAGVQISVRDTGCGMPPEQLKRLFGGVWQANAADRRGIGLGLTIVKGIIDAHGGRVWVESAVGRGTTFHFSLGTALPATSGERRKRREDRSRPGETSTSGG